MTTTDRPARGTLRWVAIIALAIVAAGSAGVVGDKVLGQPKGPTLINPDGLGLLLPPMSAQRGRATFAAKGCVVCHSVNGIGGGISSNLDAPETSRLVNPYDFAARMWRGAAAMIAL